MCGWRGLREGFEWGACFFRIGRACSVGDGEVDSRPSDTLVSQVTSHKPGEVSENPVLRVNAQFGF